MPILRHAPDLPTDVRTVAALFHTRIQGAVLKTDHRTTSALCTRVILVLAPIITVFGLVNPTTASAASGSLSPCQSIPSAYQYCVGASQPIDLSTAPPYCTPFSNGLEYQTGYKDANGVSQDWTYSNGSHACVQVNYHPVIDTTHACYYFFYVPDNGWANADITFGWWDTNGVKHYANVENEANDSGWVELHMNGTNVIDPAQAIGVEKIQFQDNNGQTPGSAYIGWATPSNYGIEEMC
jgi:hypothetical protein